LRWWVENADTVHLTRPNGIVLTKAAHEEPGGVSFPAEATGVARLVAEGPGGRVESAPILVWVVPAMPARAIMPSVPRLRVFLPLSISEAAKGAAAVARFPTEQIAAVEVLRRSTRVVSGVTDAFEREILPQQRRRLNTLRTVHELILRALRELPRSWKERR
jgi:hypothetical protein